ncbi:MAG: glycosyltransferase family 4 protein [Nitrososphaerota archaeon]|nr:glycosyltransferase family 4 protein [Nitrososphaerota archaeon]
MPSSGGLLKCLLVSPADPITGKARAGPLRRFRNPPPGVRYVHATDRVAIPTSTGQYSFSPLNVGLAAVKFALEHAFPLDYRGASLVHTFFWDIRKFTVPWVHESDQSLGQFLGGYNNIGGLVRKPVTEGYASYLNSRGCKGVITWTKWARRGFLEDGIDPEKVSVIPPPFDPVYDAKPHSGCNVLFLGRDFLRKGGDTVLAAFNRADAPGATLTYVGRAEGKSRRAVSADRRIDYRERPTNKELAEEVWPYVDILVLPTRADAFAMTVAEAMSRGIPVVASSIPPILEIVEHGKSGLLYPRGDVTGFAEGLSRLAGDPALRARMGREALARAKELFNPPAVAEKVLEVYRHA